MSNEKTTIIPELRFPDFSGSWQIEIVSNCIQLISGLHLSPDDYAVKGEIPYFTGPSDFTYKVTDINKWTKKSSNTANAGDTLITVKGSGVGELWYLTIPCVAMGRQLMAVRAKGCSSSFMYFFLGTKRSRFEDFASGNLIPGLSRSDILDLEIPIPSLSEQQKIAACLSSLDEVITAHSQKLEALKEHKKGLMQNLFPQEGEMVPAYRFPEFREDGEWKEKKLENFIDLFSGIALKSKEISDDNSGVPILRGINITEGYIRHSQDIDKYFLGDLKNLNKYLVKENNIVIGMDGSKVGKNVALITKKDKNSILIQRVARIRTNEKSDIRYVYQNFISDKFRSYVDTVNTSSGIPHISAQQIKDFKIGFPPTLQEQQKIASCLSSLDELINTQTELIEQLQWHRKGLMQGLFPKLND